VLCGTSRRRRPTPPGSAAHPRAARQHWTAAFPRVLVLFVGLLVAIAVWLLEARVGRRWSGSTRALEAVGAEQQGPMSIAEAANSVGRVGPPSTVGRSGCETTRQDAVADERSRRRTRSCAKAGRTWRAASGSERGTPRRRRRARVATRLGPDRLRRLMRERIAQGKDVAGYTERSSGRHRASTGSPRPARSGAPSRRAAGRRSGPGGGGARGAVAPQHAKVAFETTLPPDLPSIPGTSTTLAGVRESA